MIAGLLAEAWGDSESEWTPELVRQVERDLAAGHDHEVFAMGPSAKFAEFALELHRRAASQPLSEDEQDETLATPLT